MDICFPKSYLSTAVVGTIERQTMTCRSIFTSVKIEDSGKDLRALLIVMEGLAVLWSCFAISTPFQHYFYRTNLCKAMYKAAIGSPSNVVNQFFFCPEGSSSHGRALFQMCLHHKREWVKGLSLSISMLVCQGREIALGQRPDWWGCPGESKYVTKSKDGEHTINL